MKHVRAIATSIAIIAIVVTATVVVHESGHFVAGHLMGCSDISVKLFDERLETYTEMKCSGLEGVEFNAIALGGLLFILPLTAALFAFNRRTYAMIIFGFNLVVSSSDYSYLMPTAGVYATILAGAITVIYGEGLLVHRCLPYSQNQ